jgi:lysylphosphatidylglycerol synthetase-like protein (DUF2156 family)
MNTPAINNDDMLAVRPVPLQSATPADDAPLLEHAAYFWNQFKSAHAELPLSQLAIMYCILGPLFLTVFAFVSAVAASVGALEIAFAVEYGSSACIVQSQLTSLSYKQWLLVAAAIYLSSFVVFGFLYLTHRHNLMCNLHWLAYWFNVGWNIVGAVVYFETIDYHCDQNDPLRIFGLVLMAFLVWCYGKYDSNVQELQKLFPLDADA